MNLIAQENPFERTVTRLLIVRVLVECIHEGSDPDRQYW